MALWVQEIAGRAWGTHLTSLGIDLASSGIDLRFGCNLLALKSLQEGGFSRSFREPILVSRKSISDCQKWIYVSQKLVSVSRKSVSVFRKFVSIFRKVDG